MFIEFRMIVMSLRACCVTVGFKNKFGLLHGRHAGRLLAAIHDHTQCLPMHIAVLVNVTRADAK